MCIFITWKIPDRSALTSVTPWERKPKGWFDLLTCHQLHPKWKAWPQLEQNTSCFLLLVLSQAKNKSSDGVLGLRIISLTTTRKHKTSPNIKMKWSLKAMSLICSHVFNYIYIFAVHSFTWPKCFLVTANIFNNTKLSFLFFLEITYLVKSVMAKSHNTLVTTTFQNLWLFAVKVRWTFS